MSSFTATLYWPDPETIDYQDEVETRVVLGPDGRPPYQLRVVSLDEDGERQTESFVLDEPYDLPESVFYRHVTRAGEWLSSVTADSVVTAVPVEDAEQAVERAEDPGAD